MRRGIRAATAALAVTAGLVVALGQAPAEACRPSTRPGAQTCGALVVHAHNPDGLLWVPWHPERWRDKGPR